MGIQTYNARISTITRGGQTGRDTFLRRQKVRRVLQVPSNQDWSLVRLFAFHLFVLMVGCSEKESYPWQRASSQQDGPLPA